MQVLYSVLLGANVLQLSVVCRCCVVLGAGVVHLSVVCSCCTVKCCLHVLNIGVLFSGVLYYVQLPFSGKATFHKFYRLNPYYCSLDLYTPF